VLNYDFQRAVTPEIKAENDWMVKQFAKLGIQLEIRATDYNQFQDKMLKGKHQIFWWGWLADYPDAENFLFLLYGPNSKSLHEGENAPTTRTRSTTACTAAADAGRRPGEAGGDRPDGGHRAPGRAWAWGYWPYVALAFQPWVHNGKPSILVRDLAKYYRIDAASARSRPNGTSRSVAAAGAGAALLVGWPGAARGAARHGDRRRPWRHEGTDAELPDPPLGYGLLILVGVNLFTFVPVLHRQHARRHGAPEHRRQARHAGADRQVEGRARLRQAAVLEREGGGRAKLTNTILWERSVSLFALDFGRSDARQAVDIGHEIKTRMGVSLQLALPLFILQVIVSTAFALLLVFFRHSRIDFWGVVLCVLMLSISSLFYIIVGQFLFSRVLRLVPINGYAPGLDAVKFLACPSCCRCWRGWAARRACTARCSSRRSARTTCAPRAPRACRRPWCCSATCCATR
jgi:hypothetical protein